MFIKIIERNFNKFRANLMLLQCASKLAGGFLEVGDYLALMIIYCLFGRGGFFSVCSLVGDVVCSSILCQEARQYFVQFSFRGLEIQESQKAKSSA